MIATEKTASLARRIWQNQNSMRLIYGSRWPAMVEGHRALIRAAMQKAGIDNELQAVANIQRETSEPMPEATAAILLAVAVEMIEEGA